MGYLEFKHYRITRFNRVVGEFLGKSGRTNHGQRIAGRTADSRGTIDGCCNLAGGIGCIPTRCAYRQLQVHAEGTGLGYREGTARDQKLWRIKNNCHPHG